MKKCLFIVASFVSASVAFTQSYSDTLIYIGSEQIWTVPCGATNIEITTYGAQGAAGSTLDSIVNVGGLAGLGNRVTGAWGNLVPGDQIYVYVGGQAVGTVGGFNGGGQGVSNPSAKPSGGGGGATDIRYPTNSVSDRIQVSGGGGGGGNAGFEAYLNPITGGNGGNGGGNQILYGNSLDGQTGTDVIIGQFTIPSAWGGTVAGPGVYGNGCAGFLGSNGGIATTFQGANGGQGNNGFGAAQTTMAPSGGGGGGGYIGGNGGGGGSAGTFDCGSNGFGPGGGGAAGSNYFDGTPSDFSNGVNAGNGFVVINYTVEVTTEIDENFSIPCVGQSTVIFGMPGNGSYSVLSGPAADMNDGEFTPSQETTYEIVYSTVQCGITSSDTVSITINCDLASLDENNVDFSISPNPINNLLQISGALNSAISIRDLSGKEVFVSKKLNTETINFSDYNSGIYFISIEKEGKTSQLKFLKN